MEKLTLQKALGSVIKAKMAEGGDSLNTVAGRTRGLATRSTIDRAIKGDVAVGIDVLEGIAKAFHMTATELLAEAERFANPAASKRNDPAWVGKLSAAQKALQTVVMASISAIPDEVAKSITTLLMAYVKPDPDDAPLKIAMPRKKANAH